MGEGTVPDEMLVSIKTNMENCMYRDLIFCTEKPVEWIITILQSLQLLCY